MFDPFTELARLLREFFQPVFLLHQLALLLFQGLDLRRNLGQGLAFDLRSFVVEPAVGQDDGDEAENGGDEVRFLLIELLPLERALGHQIHFHRALGHVAQSQAHDLAEGMGHFGQFLQINRRVNLNIAEGIEVFDRQVELLREKLRRVRHDRSPARQEQTQRRRTALLSAVELDRLVDLDV